MSDWVGRRRGMFVVALVGMVLVLPYSVVSSGPASAAAKRTVRASASTATVSPGQTFFVSGRVSKTPPRKKVIVERQVRARWVAVAKGRTAKKGRFKVAVALTTPGPVVLRARVPKWRALKSVTSNPTTVKVVQPVRSRTTSLELIGAPAAAGDEFTIAGSVAPPAPGTGVVLQELVGGRWATAMTATVSVMGTFAWPMTAAVGGARSFRAVVNNTTGYASSTSSNVVAPAVAAASVDWGLGSRTFEMVDGSAGQWSTPFTSVGMSQSSVSVQLGGPLADVADVSIFVNGSEGSVTVTVPAGSPTIGEHEGHIQVLSQGVPVGAPREVRVRVAAPTASELPDSVYGPSEETVPEEGRGGLINAVMDTATGSLEDVARAVADEHGLLLGGSVPELSTVDFIAPTDDVSALVEVLRADVRIVEVTTAPRATPASKPKDEVWTRSSDERRWQLEAVNLPAAWDVSTGARTVVGILDQGFAVTHEDLAPNVVREVGSSPATGEWWEGGSHGNNVAGAACAARNNAKVNLIGQVSYVGTTGSAPDCILSVSHMTWATVTPSQYVDKLNKLASTSAHVINVSGGWGAMVNGCVEPLFGRDQTMFENRKAVSAMIRDVARRHPDKLFVFSAGNEGQRVACSGFMNLDVEPNVIVVANTTRDRTLAADSNRGYGVTVAAPGASVYLPDRATSDYITTQGTSYSAPLVAGIAALAKTAKTDVSASRIKDCIVASATGRPVTGQSFGIVDAKKTVDCAKAAPPVIPGRVWTVGPLSIPLNANWGPAISADPLSGYANDLTNSWSCVNCSTVPPPTAYASLNVWAYDRSCESIPECLLGTRVGNAPTVTIGGVTADRSGRITLTGGYSGTGLYWCFTAEAVCLTYVGAASHDLAMSANLTATLERAYWD